MYKLLCISLSMILYTSAYSQTGKIGIIEIFGLEKVPERLIREALAVKEGDDFSAASFDKAAARARLLAVPGITKAHISTVCCDDKNGLWICFVGVSEKPGDNYIYNDAPAGSVRLGEDIVQTYQQFDSLLIESVLTGQSQETDSLGYSFLSYTPAIPVQLKLVHLANEQTALLKDVLENSADAKHRAVAAWMIAYTGDKQDIAKQLLNAIKDNDENVRNNAARCLAILGRYAIAHPEMKINIPATPFIQMISSVVWTDRNKGLAVLESLSRNRDEGLFNLLARESLSTLAEMAKWKNPGHAAFAMAILGRMADIPDKEIFEAIDKPGRELIVNEYADRIRKKITN